MTRTGRDVLWLLLVIFLFHFFEYGSEVGGVRGAGTAMHQGCREGTAGAESCQVAEMGRYIACKYAEEVEKHKRAYHPHSARRAEFAQR